MTIGFTKKAQNALNRALSTASEMGHASVGTEHLLLGLLAEKDSVAARVLEEHGVTAEKTRKLIGESVGFGEPTNLTPRDVTPRVKRIIETSAGIAVGMGHGYIGTEHLLLAAVEEGESYAARLIREEGASAEDVKRGVLAVLTAAAERTGSRTPGQDGFRGESAENPRTARGTPSPSTAPISPKRQPKDASIPSSAGRARPPASSASSPAARRTIPASSESRESAKPPSSKGSPAGSPRGPSPRPSRERRSSASISPRWWPEPNTGANSRRG